LTFSKLPEETQATNNTAVITAAAANTAPAIFVALGTQGTFGTQGVAAFGTDLAAPDTSGCTVRMCRIRLPRAQHFFRA